MTTTRLHMPGRPLWPEMGLSHHPQQVSPVDITVVKNCAPAAAEDKAKQNFAKICITEIQVQSGCTAQLNDHTIIADSSIQIETDIQHFEWNFSGLSSRITPDNIKQALHDVSHNFQFNHLTLSGLIQNINEKRNGYPVWVHILAITGVVIAIVASLGFMFFTSMGFRFLICVRHQIVVDCLYLAS